MDINYKINVMIILISICHILPSEERSSLLDSKEVKKEYIQNTNYSNFYTSVEQQDVTKKEHKINNAETAVSSRAVKNDPWQGYYDFLINEGSYKFWAVFQVATALVLIYSAAAAIYYAKYNFIQPDYEYDYFFGRSDSDPSYSTSIWTEENAQTFQRIMDAISSKKYS